MTKTKCILIVTPFYLPGNRAGGPIRSLSNIVEELGDDFKFRVITDDREFKGTEPYKEVEINSWNQVGKAEVYYCGVDRNKFNFFKQFLNELEYDIIYLNSFFHSTFTIIPLVLKKLGLLQSKPIVVAPRGELTPGALEQKRIKKNLYLKLAKIVGLYKNITWHAASNQEAINIKKWFGEDTRVRIAENIPEKIDDHFNKASKHAGQLKMVFVSRISPKKNIKGALEILRNVSSRVQYDIYGPVEDPSYWKKCQKLINMLPPNITVSYCGELIHSRVSATIAEYDLFFLPTFGENYGHVIIEALSTGCPVLISDQTPWNDLEENGAGWSYALNQPQEFTDKIENVASVSEHVYDNWCHNAKKYARLKSDREYLVKQTKQVFLS